MLHGPNYGIVVQFKDTQRPFEDILNLATNVYQTVIKALPGLRTAIYHHYDNHYSATYVFETELDVDAALEKLRPLMEARVPGVFVVKADVITGEQMQSKLPPGVHGNNKS